MVDLLRTQQLDIMLSLGSMCLVIAFFILMTGMNTKKKKALFILEAAAAVLLISARLTWIYNGQPDDFSKLMSQITNFFDFFGVVVVIFAFNQYLRTMFSETEDLSPYLIRFKINDILTAIDAILILLSPFTGSCYYLDESNTYFRGPAVGVCFSVPLIILLIHISLILQYFKRLSKNMRFTVLLFAFMPFPASILQFCFYGLETANITIVAMAIFLYLIDLWDISRSADMSARAIAANEAKSAFLSNMSHEIRTPINAVMGMNEMILRKSDDPEILAYSENIKTAGGTLLGIINDILDISKIESGKIDIIPVEYDTFKIIYNLVNMIKTRAEAKNLDLRVDIDSSLPGVLYGDEVRIKQVITNILTNAVKYTDRGFVTFQIKCEERLPESDKVVLRVAVIDTGIGIREEDMDRLFSKFERVDEIRNRNIEGTGLGLSITKNLLEMMGSELHVESVYGEGSTFWFLLEQDVVSWDELGDYPELHRSYTISRNSYKERLKAPDARILIVDDYPLNLDVIKGLLERTLITVDTARNGTQGLKLTDENKYDVIFLDHMMPGKDGIETLHELRSSYGNPNSKVPAICLTANAVAGAREGYIAEGFDDYLTKPVDSERLEELLIKYLPKEKIKVMEE